MNRFLTAIILSGISPFLACQGHAQTEELNFTTLFTSPAEREYLDFLRADFLINNPEEDFNINQEVPPVPLIDNDTDVEENVETRYQLSGIFMKRDGSRTAWINGSSIDESNLPANMQILMSGAHAVLRISTDNGRFDLKPGQTLDVVRGEIMENWDGQNEVLPESEVPATTSPAQQPEDSADVGTAPIQGLDETQTLSQEVNQDELSVAAADLSNLDAETINEIVNGDNPEDLNTLIELLQAAQDAQTSNVVDQ